MKPNSTLFEKPVFSLSNLLAHHITADDAPTTGLFLLDLPTGFGKTHAVLNLMFDAYHSQPQRKIIFLTDLKKNLPFKEFKQRFQEEEWDKFNRDVLELDAYTEYLIKNWEKLEQLVTPTIEQTEEFRKLKYRIGRYMQLEKTKGLPSGLKEETKKEISEEAEPAFRRYLRKWIYSLSDKPASRLDIIKKDHPWIYEFYPSALSYEKRVLFMSVAKFLTKNDPLTKPVHDFFDPDFLQNALIFIDEFDASKEVLLKKIIEDNLRRKVDILGLTRDMQDAFLQHDLPSILAREQSVKDDGSLNKVQRKQNTLGQGLSDLKKRIEKLSSNHALRYHFRTVERSHERRFLFYDWEFRTIAKDGMIYINLETDKVEQLNLIHFENESAKDGKKSAWKLLTDIEHYLRLFVVQLKHFAENYQKYRTKSRSANDPEYPLEAARRSVLNALSLPQDYQDFLIELAQARQNLTEEPSKNASIGLLKNLDEAARQFYDEGYRYYAFEDSEFHDLQSKIYAVSISRTPEAWLGDWTEQNLVVGISATAKIDTVVGNYDLQYMRKRLGDNLREISAVEWENLRIEYERQNTGIEKVDFRVEFIEEFPAALRPMLEVLFPNDELTVNELLSEIERRVKSDDKGEPREFLAQRLVRIARVFEHFISSENCRSMLCFLNAHPKKESETFPLEVLEMLFGHLLIMHKKQGVTWKILTSKDFDSEKKDLLNRLSAGEKIFVLTTYKTLGAGQNMQYPAPEGLKNLVRLPFLPGREKSKEKDFDGIYLDKPTNLLVSLREDEFSDENLNKRIFQIESLAESGSLSYGESKKEIVNSFRRRLTKYFKSDPSFYSTIYSTPDFEQQVLKQVIQAVGRIGRASLKSPEVLLLAEHSLVPHLHRLDDGKFLLSPEMRALHQKALKTPAKPASDFRYQAFSNRAELANQRSNANLRRLLAIGWSSEESRRVWQQLRNHLLCHPTLTTEEIVRSPFAWAYLEMPEPGNRCNFRVKPPETGKEEKLKEAEIYFQMPAPRQVSASAARLDQLLKCPTVQYFFQSQNFALHFAPAPFILTPVAFERVYKGALGEVVGKHLIETHLGYKLTELSGENFEKFDFELADRQGIFVDFKHWSEHTSMVSAGEVVPEVRKKMQAVRASKILIINLLADNNFPPVRSKAGDLLEIPRLLDPKTGQVDSTMLDTISTFIQNS